MQSNNNPILVRYSKRILNKFNDIILYALTIKVDIIFFSFVCSLSHPPFAFLCVSPRTHTQSLLSLHRFAITSYGPSECKDASVEIRRNNLEMRKRWKFIIRFLQLQLMAQKATGIKPNEIVVNKCRNREREKVRRTWIAHRPQLLSTNAEEAEQRKQPTKQFKMITWLKISIVLNIHKWQLST